MIKTFFTLGVIQIAIMAIQLVKTKGMALLLGPDLVGVMAVVDKLVAVAVQTASLSLPFAATVYLPTLWVRDREEFLRLLARMRSVLVVSTFVTGVGGAILTYLRPDVWGVELEPYRSIVILAFLGVPALALSPFVQNVLAGRLQERSALGYTLLYASVVTITAVVGVLGWGLAGYYGMFAPAGLLLVAVALYRIRRSSERAPIPPPPPTENGDEARKRVRELSGGPWLPRLVWRFSLLLLALTFIMPFGALFVHYSVLVGRGTEAAGLMAAAFGIALAVKNVLGAANAVFLTPNVNRGGPQEDTLRWANAYGRTLALLAALLVPPLLLWPELPVRLLYSAAFLPGARYVSIFVLAEVIGLLVAVYSSLPIAFDHLGFHVVYSVSGQLLMVLAASWLIPAYGILGAGVAMLAPHIVALFAIASFLRYWRKLPLPMENVLLLCMVVAALVLASFLGIRYGGFDPAHIAIKVGAYGAMLFLFRTRLTPEERKRLWSLPRELLSPSR